MAMTVYNTTGLLSNSTVQMNISSNNSLHRGPNVKEIDLMYLNEELLTVDTVSKWILVVSIVISIFSNGLVVLCKCKSPIRNPYHYLILNVAICDLIYTFIQIFQAHRRFNMHVWHFGRFMCKAMSLSPSSLTTSMFTMTFMSIERFITIVYPFRQRLSRRTVFLVVIALWLVAICLHMPLFLTRDIYVTTSGHAFCRIMWPPDPKMRESYYLVSFVVTYPVPLLIIVISTINIVYTALTRTSKKRQCLRIHVSTRANVKPANPMIKHKKLFITFACILLAFILTTTPNQALMLWMNFAPKQHVPFKELRFTFFMLFMFAPLVHIHTITNPLIYSFSDEKFRKEVRQFATETWRRVSPQRNDKAMNHICPRNLALHRYETPALLQSSPNSAPDDSSKKYSSENQATLEERNGETFIVLASTS